MAKLPTLHVIANGDAKLPHVDADGRPQRGRFTGRDQLGTPRAEHVPATVYYLRALDHGDLVVVPPPEAPASVAEIPVAPEVTETGGAPVAGGQDDPAGADGPAITLDPAPAESATPATEVT